MAGAKPTRGRAVELRTLPIAHQFPRLPIPIEIRPYVWAALAAGCAGETILNVGQPKIIRSLVATDGDRVAAAVVGAIDK